MRCDAAATAASKAFSAWILRNVPPRRPYSSSQEPLVYQPADRLFCVFAQYEPLREDPLDGLLVSRALRRNAAGMERQGRVYALQARQLGPGRQSLLRAARRQSRANGHPAPSRQPALPSPSRLNRPIVPPLSCPFEQVNNYANDGAVNGPVVGTSEVGGGPLTTATIPNKRRPSKLRVAISLGGGDAFRPIQLGRGGDYWVVAAGQSVNPADRSGNLYGERGAWGLCRDGGMGKEWGNGQLGVPVAVCRCSLACPHLPSSTHPPATDWAIVTGGRPNRRSNGACATGSPFGLVRRFQTNNVGLWLFTRKPVDPVNTQVSLRQLAGGSLNLLERAGRGSTPARKVPTLWSPFAGPTTATATALASRSAPFVMPLSPPNS